MLFLVALLLGFSRQTAPAHSPFESSARITISAGQIEATLTSGTGLAGALLKGSGIDPARASGFPGTTAAPEISERIIALEASGQPIAAESVKFLGDGLECMLVITFPRPPGSAFKLSARYAALVPPGSVSALVVADEAGRMIGSHLVTSGNAVMEFALAQTESNLAATDSSPARDAARVQDSLPTDTSGLDSQFATATAPKPAATPSFLEYLKLGIHHIVTGYDHLLFLFGLLVGCKRVGAMLSIITCFTLAHSITLALAALDVIAIPPRIVEPIIAASIIFVGIENFRPGDNVKTRCWLALGFGLIHGFGFAGALRETGLGGTAGSLLSALLAFNLGVELGQLVIAAIFLGVLWRLCRCKPIEQYATPVISSVVITLGGWWLLERTLLT